MKKKGTETLRRLLCWNTKRNGAPEPAGWQRWRAKSAGVLIVAVGLGIGAGSPVSAGQILDDFSITVKWRGPFGPPEPEYPGASVSFIAEDGVATLSHSTTGYAFTDGDFIIDFSSYKGLIIKVTALTPDTHWRVQFPEYYSDADTFESARIGSIFVPFPEPLAGTGTYSHSIRLAVLAAPPVAGPASVSFDSIRLGNPEDAQESIMQPEEKREYQLKQEQKHGKKKLSHPGVQKKEDIVFSDDFEKGKSNWDFSADTEGEQLLTSNIVRTGKYALEGTGSGKGWIRHLLKSEELEFVAGENTTLTFWYYADCPEGFGVIHISFYTKYNPQGERMEKRYTAGVSNVLQKRWNKVSLNLSRDITKHLLGTSVGGREIQHKDYLLMEIASYAKGKGRFIIDDVRIENIVPAVNNDDGVVFYDNFEAGAGNWTFEASREARQYVSNEVFGGKVKFLEESETLKGIAGESPRLQGVLIGPGRGYVRHVLKENILNAGAAAYTLSFWYYADSPKEPFEALEINVQTIRGEKYTKNISPAALRAWRFMAIDFAKDINLELAKQKIKHFDITAFTRDEGTFIIDEVKLTCSKRFNYPAEARQVWGQFNLDFHVPSEDRNISPLGHLYWYGELYFFSQKPLKILEDDWNIVPRDGGDVFGVGYKWPRPFEIGYKYKIFLTFRDFPDFITIDNQKVWNYATGEIKLNPQWSYAVINYIPRRKGEGIIWAVRDTKQGVGDFPLSLGYYEGGLGVAAARPMAFCVRYPLNEDEKAPKYEAWKPPYKVWQSEKVLVDYHPLRKIPVKWDKPPLTTPDYPVDEIDIEYETYYIKYPEFIDNIIKANKINFLWPLDQNYYKNYAKPNLDIFNAFMQYGASPGMMWHGDQWEGYIFRPGTPEVLPTLEDYVLNSWMGNAISEANKITEDSPNARVYLDYPEDERYDAVFYFPEYKEYQSQNHYVRLHKVFEIYQEWKRIVMSKLKHPERCIIESRPGCGVFPAAYHYKEGADFLVYTLMNGEPFSMILSNARGASRAYKKKFGNWFDPWIGSNSASYHPDVFEHLAYLLYFGGTDWLSGEASPGYYDPGRMDWKTVLPEDKGGPNAYGSKWLDGVRFMRTHPQRGEPVVKIGIVRGFGDLWTWVPIQIHVDARASEKIDFLRTVLDDRRYIDKKDADKSMRDYNLLNLFFSHYGNYRRADIERRLTGTPYGPVDMLPWDTPLKHLKTFDLLIYMGLNAMDEEQLYNLKGYIKHGGRAVISVGQLQTEGDEPRRLYPGDWKDFLGADIITKEGIPVLAGEEAQIEFKINKEVLKGKVDSYYQIEPIDCEVMANTVEGQPIVTRKRYGKGEVYFYATRFMSKVSEELNKTFLSSLADKSKILTLKPESDWVEYIVQEKVDTYVLALFNHGRLRFPSGIGKDPGEWRGKVELNLDKLPKLKGRSLEALTVKFDPYSAKFDLKPLPLSQQGGSISLNVTIDKRTEVIIGPVGKARKQFFYGGRVK